MQCSVTCGKGQKTRIVVCRYEDGSLAMDSECEEDAKPISKRECKKPSCAKWKSGKWGEVSLFFVFSKEAHLCKISLSLLI